MLRGKVCCPFRFRLRRTAKWATSGFQGQLLRIQGTCNSVPIFCSTSTFLRIRQLVSSANFFAFLFATRTVKVSLTYDDRQRDLCHYFRWKRFGTGIRGEGRRFSNFLWFTYCINKTFMILLSPSRQIPGWWLTLGQHRFPPSHFRYSLITLTFSNMQCELQSAFLSKSYTSISTQIGMFPSGTGV